MLSTSKIRPLFNKPSNNKTIYFFFILVHLLLLSIPLRSEEPFWMPLNMPEGGDVANIICTPGDTLYIYEANGIFRSTDHAESWHQIKKGFTQAVAVDSKNQIFAVNCLDNLVTYPSVLTRSLDNGLTWDTLTTVWNWIDSNNNREHNRFIYDLKFDSDNRLYAISSSGEFHSGKYALLYSDDIGQTWSCIDTVNKYNTTFEAVYPYKKDSFVIRGIIPDTTNNQGNVTELISITHDNGKSYINKIFSNSYNNNFIDVCFISETEFYIVYNFSINYTKDGGKTWYSIYYPNQNSWNLSFYAKSNKELYLINDTCLFHTTDNGANWEILTNRIPKFTMKLRQVNLTLDHSGNAYYSDIFGIKKSTDSGKTFKRSSKGYINLSNTRSIISDKNGNIYIGYDGIYVSRDNGMSWEHNELNDQQVISILPLNDGSILAGLLFLYQIYRSTDYGKNWNIWSEDIPSAWNWIENKEGILFASSGLNFLCRSKDKGKTWEYLKNAKAGETFSCNNRDELFAGTSSGGGEIFSSIDNGESWNKSYKSIGDEYPITPIHFEYFFFHPRKPIGFAYMDALGFYKTTDNGASWTRSGYYEWSRPMVVDSIGNLWSGFMRSTDDGATWKRIDSGIDPTHEHDIFAMCVSPEGYIFLVTRYGGIYRSLDRFVSVKEQAPETNEITISNSPNPFSEKTEITYTLPGPGIVSITISDILGRQVFRQPPEYKDRGVQSFSFISEGLTGGIYFLTIESGRKRASIILNVLKN